ncbi:Uncharacterized protein BM_BM8301 [Brugia malayi]|uniref:Bm1951, isoform a n=2 Tax=Brugia malayi TaxID=6279 RepID=A0A4E9F2X1_BRUMA|nr:Uncharacterized protein BM_BM8301 [Brugia malayi]VIO90599.1 Uncharacterized protein BM_BM8301 [Brugia malayi]
MKTNSPLLQEFAADYWASKAIGAPASRPSSASKTNPAGGTASYWEETVHQEGVGAYMVKGDQWYGYDNEETIRIKMKWLKEKGYGGAFIWALDFDDFTGKSCGKGPYPLLNAISSELEGESENPEITTEEPSITETEAYDTDETEGWLIVRRIKMLDHYLFISYAFYLEYDVV